MGNSARIDELRKKFDENPRRYFAPLANEYRKAGDLEQAIFICQEYLPQQPGHMSGHIVYGQALYESGRDEEAKAVFETALSLDPENLIALKHLGDIAHAAADIDGARTWYQRVLDADPRNDEIIQLLSTLHSAPIPPRERFTPLATATVESPNNTLEFIDTDDSGHVDGFDSGDQSEIERSEEAIPRAFDDVDLPPIPPEHPAPAAATTSDEGLLDLDDFSLGGVPMNTPATPEPVQESSTTAGLDGDVNISGGFTLGADDDQFEADPFAIAATAPSADTDLATDIDLGLVDDSGAASADDVQAASLSGLETFEAGVIASAPIDAPVLETETFFDLPPIDEIDASATSESAPIDGGHDGLDIPELTPTESALESVSEPVLEEPATEHAAESAESVESEEPAAADEPAEAFVTETMAELYIQQGHLDSALDIYKRLVEQRPDEPDLRDRLRAIEDRLFSGDASADYAAPAHGGPTIREFLIGLVSRGSTNGGSAPAVDVSPSREDTVIHVPQPRNSGPSETISGSIDALFSGAPASDSDAGAANALAAAFASTPEPEPHRPTPLPGTPAHRAQDELSLDHVFKANTPPRETAGTNGFSFDQFFADEMTDAGAESSGDSAPGSPEATDDIAQFNAWLNGLKKT